MWWLRSPGFREIYAVFVSSDGSVLEYGYTVDYDAVAVRPSLWVNIDF